MSDNATEALSGEELVGELKRRGFRSKAFVVKGYPPTVKEDGKKVFDGLFLLIDGHIEIGGGTGRKANSKFRLHEKGLWVSDRRTNNGFMSTFCDDWDELLETLKAIPRRVDLGV